MQGLIHSEWHSKLRQWMLHNVSTSIQNDPMWHHNEESSKKFQSQQPLWEPTWNYNISSAKPVELSITVVLSKPFYDFLLYIALKLQPKPQLYFATKLIQRIFRGWTVPLIVNSFSTHVAHGITTATFCFNKCSYDCN